MTYQKLNKLRKGYRLHVYYIISQRPLTLVCLYDVHFLSKSSLNPPLIVLFSIFLTTRGPLNSVARY
jgi:hypothetical protein